MTGKQRLTLAQRVRKLRDDKGWSQQKLATEAGLSMSILSQIEQGRVRDPRGSTLRALAIALGVTVDGLLAEGPDAD